MTPAEAADKAAALLDRAAAEPTERGAMLATVAREWTNLGATLAANPSMCTAIAAAGEGTPDRLEDGR